MSPHEASSVPQDARAFPCATQQITTDENPYNNTHGSGVMVIGPEQPQDEGVACVQGKKRNWLIAAAAVAVLAAVALAIVFTVDGNNDEANPDPITSPTDLEARFVTLRKAVANYSKPSAFVDLDSPQSQALQWLVYQDKTIDVDDLKRLPQRYAIMVLFYACSGQDWQSFTTTLDKEVDKHECDFYGFECNESDEIVKVDLSFERLAGRIPPEISLWSHVIWLNLSHNFLEGSIPDEVFEKMSNLEILALDSNELGNSISPDIGKLTKLEMLTLNGNMLTGTLPSTLTALTDLRILNLGSNKLTGPVLEYAPSWPKIEEITLIYSPFNGTVPEEIDQLSHLQILHIGDTQLQTTIPSTITSLTALHTISFGGPGIIAEFPTDIGKLSRLVDLGMTGRGITGSIPPSIGKLTDIKFFLIGQTSMTGPLPSEIGLLTKLQRLVLENNEFSGSLPNEMGLPPQLEYLYFWGNKFDGTIPDSFCNGPRHVQYDCYLDCNCCGQGAFTECKI